MTLEVVSVGLSAVAILIGTGGLGAFIQASNKHAVQVYRIDLAEKENIRLSNDVSQLKNELAVMKNEMSHISAKLNKLDILDSLNAKMEIVTSVLQNVIPRPEAEAKYSGIEKRLENVEAVVMQKE